LVVELRDGEYGKSLVVVTVRGDLMAAPDVFLNQFRMPLGAVTDDKKRGRHVELIEQI
jgi:hypothetical protein